MFWSIFDFWSKFRFSIDIAQTPLMTMNFHELNIHGIALYHEKQENQTPQTYPTIRYFPFTVWAKQTTGGQIKRCRLQSQNKSINFIILVDVSIITNYLSLQSLAKVVRQYSQIKRWSWLQFEIIISQLPSIMCSYLLLTFISQFLLLVVLDS